MKYGEGSSLQVQVNQNSTGQIPKQSVVSTTVYTILFSISLVHLLNDSITAAIPAMFPVLKESLHLNFAQVGMIGFVLNITSTVLQPLIGNFTDSRPQPKLLPMGVLFSLVGVIALAMASQFMSTILAVMLIGVGSAVLHPESSRVAFLAAGGKRGLAQSIFQTGGNIGQSLAPLLVMLLFVPLGQQGAFWFIPIFMLALAVQFRVAKWYGQHYRPKQKGGQTKKVSALPQSKIIIGLAVLTLLIFSKSIYTAGMTNFYAFYLIHHFGISVKESQLYLFMMLAAGTVGTFCGGPLADRFGRKAIIWFSILGAAPFALFLPYVSLFWSGVFSLAIGFILFLSMSVIIVYAQELVPGKVGMISGLFFGLSFGLAGIGSAGLGYIADHTSIEYIMHVCAYLPLLGLLTVFLPKTN